MQVWVPTHVDRLIYVLNFSVDNCEKINGRAKDDILLSKIIMFEDCRKDAGVSVGLNQITFCKYLQHVNNYMIQNNISKIVISSL